MSLGARSLNSLSTRFCHRSCGSITCESDEMTSYSMAPPAPLVVPPVGRPTDAITAIFILSATVQAPAAHTGIALLRHPLTSGEDSDGRERQWHQRRCQP